MNPDDRNLTQTEKAALIQRIDSLIGEIAPDIPDTIEKRMPIYRLFLMMLKDDDPDALWQRVRGPAGGTS